MVSKIEINPEFDPTYAEAADWFARLHDAEITVEETMEWQRLMAQRPDFARAYSRLEEVWNALDELPPSAAAEEHDEHDRYDASIPVSQYLKRRGIVMPRPSRLLMAASVSAVAVGVAWFVLGSRGSAQIVSTPHNQNQAVILADGSRVNLGANTRLEIRLSAQRREINLVRGEAFFAVAKDAKRPFTVHSGDTSVTAVGTEFSVNRGASTVVIAVLEGRVIVASGESRSQVSARATKPLVAGEQVALSMSHGDKELTVDTVKAPIGWYQGHLAIQSEPLSRVLLDVNRYAPKPIAVDDPSLGDLMITGTVLRDDVAGWLASLEQAFPVRVIDEADRITIRSR